MAAEEVGVLHLQGVVDFLHVQDIQGLKTMETSEESDLNGAVVLVAEEVEVLHLQGVEDFLQEEERRESLFY